MRVSDAADAWLDDVMFRCSGFTIRHYRTVLKRWQAFNGIGDIDLEEVTPSRLRGFIHALDSEGVQPASIRQYRTVLSAFFGFAVEEGWLSINPLSGGRIRTPRVPHRTVVAYTAAEVRQMLDATEGQPRLLEFRDKAAICLLFDGGMRRSELCSLKVCDIDLQEHSCRLLGKGKKERVVRYSRTTAKALTLYLRDAHLSDSSPLFFNQWHRPLTPDTLYHIIERLTQKAGIHKRGVHKLRHSHAVEFLRNGGALNVLQRQLGHTNPLLTLRYAQIVEGDTMGAIEEQRYSPVEALGRR